MRSTAILGAVLLASLTTAQPDSTWMPYTSAYTFRSGVYRTFDEFRNNAPGIPIEALTDDQGLRIRDIDEEIGRLYHVDSTGQRVRIDGDHIWGYCTHDIVRVAAGNGFFRIGRMGALAHLIIERTVNDYDPYASGYGGYTVQEERMIDTMTGELLPFDAGGMDKALLHDPPLSGEFRALAKRERRKAPTLYRFLQRYNERNPLLVPPSGK
ncbi:MAG: hypothetical protein H6597_00910 [Flavobacteriales bacterium]|nr:hypothetical protein [Flavobacteriales bacterium]